MEAVPRGRGEAAGQPCDIFIAALKVPHWRATFASDHPSPTDCVDGRLRKLPDPVRLLDCLDWLEEWNRRQSPFLRIPLGLLFCLGGMFFLLPVLGLWMLPIGLLILSEDIPWLRDRRKRFEGWLRRVLGESRARHQARLEH